ncbi:LuxR C-terminal-related transcriptional regulator [Microbispora sp. ATCC PTA-5024]|uniref:LuxR C-terminal-related transcriptional regulator n=1 Tax=Microbispora sp. ATCC PTA-5024 TaxID=316330 RepID=UPI0003DB7BE2|nr:response regulator transcription factor [Microbispora sp. ATCC PTA-5024]ETK37761.1 hypothetical protein MPTA5024_02175 [Microbispora sp. ATCC PTA-5024]
MARSGVAAIIEAQPDLQIVAMATTLAQALRLGAGLRPDLFIVDVPRVDDGVMHATRLLCASGMESRVLLLTSDTGGYEIDLLRYRTCVLKSQDIAASELVAIIRVVGSGYLPMDGELVRRLADTLPSQHDDDVEAHLVGSLTRRQREVLNLMAMGLSNPEIAQRLTLATSTVKSHVKDIFERLGTTNRLQTVIYANNVGELPSTGGGPKTSGRCSRDLYGL